MLKINKHNRINITEKGTHKGITLELNTYQEFTRNCLENCTIIEQLLKE